MKKSAMFVLVTTLSVALMAMLSGNSAAQSSGRGPTYGTTTASATATASSDKKVLDAEFAKKVCDVLTSGVCPAASAAASAVTIQLPDFNCVGSAIKKDGHCECPSGLLPVRLQRKSVATAKRSYTDSKNRIISFYSVDVACAVSAEKLQQDLGIVATDLRSEMAQMQTEIASRSEEERLALYAAIEDGDKRVMNWVLKNFVTVAQVDAMVGPKVNKVVSELNRWTNRVHLNLDLGVHAYKLPNSSYVAGCFAPSIGIPFGTQSDFGANVAGRFCYGGGTNFNNDGSARWAGAAGLSMNFTYALSADKQNQILFGGSWMEIVRESGIKMAGYTVGPELGFRIAIPGTNGAAVPFVGVGATKDTARDNPRGNGPNLGAWGGINAQWTF